VYTATLVATFSAVVATVPEENTGALSLMSDSVTVRSCTVVLAPSLAVTWTA
jgi:hypothetical protein